MPVEAPERPAILTAVPVAFTADGAVDLEGSRDILRFVRDSGNEGAFVLGTTGEFAALTLPERAALTALSVRELGDTMRVVVHVGAASLWETLHCVRHAREAGATEVAVLTPYYVPVDDDAMVEYFARVAAEADGMRVYVYVYRDRSGNAVSPALLTRLARISGIVGVKVSAQPAEDFGAYRAVVPDSFELYTGSDADLVRASAFGTRGAVSGVSSAFPAPFQRLAAAFVSGDADALIAAQDVVDDVVSVIAGNVAHIKHALRLRGVSAGVVRMPIPEPDSAAVLELERIVASY